MKHTTQQDAPDALDLIAECLPVPTSNKQLAKWLHKMGVADLRKRRREGGGSAKKARLAAAPRAPRAGASASVEFALLLEPWVALHAHLATSLPRAA